jgi:hypothetical protein
VLRIALPLAALFTALSIAACGSSNDDKGGSGSATTKATTTAVVTTTTKNGATKTTTVKVPPPGKVSTVQLKTARDRSFVAGLNRRCIATIGSTRSIAAPTGTVASGRAYARRAAGPITQTIAVLRSSRPPKGQVGAVTTFLASYGETRPLLRVLLAQKGAQRKLAPTAAKQLPPALKRVRTYAAAARLRSCRPPGF